MIPLFKSNLLQAVGWRKQEEDRRKLEGRTWGQNAVIITGYIIGNN